jgi:hypothetical protein
MKADVFQAHQLFSANPPLLSGYGRRLLAEGDSWFTLGTLNLPKVSNILFNLDFAQSTAIVTCAYPGDTLQHMVDNLNDFNFDRLLRKRNFASYWEALLISGGGNDLIDAAQVPSVDAQGRPVPREQRLLLTAEEAAQSTAPEDPARYISDAGWARLATYLQANFAELVKRRDQGPSKDRPMFAHTYAVPTVRPSGTLNSPQGWLYPAMMAYGIPAADWHGVTSLLFSRLRFLLLDMDQASGLDTALPHLHVFDSAGLSSIIPASPGVVGPSGDWVNEIHLTVSGYRKLGRALSAYVAAVLSKYP